MQIAKHFTPYNPDDSDLFILDSDLQSDIDQQSQESSSSSEVDSIDKGESNQFEEKQIDSQFTLLGSSQANLSSFRTITVSEFKVDDTQCTISETNSPILDLVNACDTLSQEIQNDTFRKTVWADNMAMIVDQHLKEDEDLNEKTCNSVLEIQDSDSVVSEEEQLLFNSPVSEYLDFDQVNKQIEEIDPYFDQSEAFYAEQCVSYWDARGWLGAIESGECDDEILESIEYHKRVLLDRVKTRLEAMSRDQANRDLLSRAQSILEMEQTSLKIDNELSNPEQTNPKKTILFESIVSMGSIMTKSIMTYTTNWIKHVWDIGYDVYSCCRTIATEMSNITLGEEFCFIEFGNSLLKLSSKVVEFRFAMS